MFGKAISISDSAVPRRLRPALCFIFAIFILAGLALGTGYGAMPPAEKRYAKAKADVESLKSDSKRGAFRAPWEELIKEFDEIYKSDPKWPNRPAALYQAASATEELAKRSHAKSDFKDAAERFESLALKHSASRLADDSLYRAAIIRSKFLNDKKGATVLLKRIKNQYPKGDMRRKAAELENQLENDASADKGKSDSDKKAPVQKVEKKNEEPVPSKAKAGRQAEVSQISWSSPDKKSVQLTIELDRSTTYKITVQQGNQAKRIPPRLLLDVNNSKVLPQMKAGARVSGSLLTRVGVDDAPKNYSRLTFEFSKLGRYVARMEQDPFRIVITVYADGSLKKNERERMFGDVRMPDPGSAVSDSRTISRPVTASTEDLAEQLGLTVQTVLIDAGHGGKDPGTIHNNIVERDVVLDISRRVGKLLADNGLNIEFSRKTDLYVPLTSRTRLANDKRVDLFLSIHVNANKDVNTEGFETYYLDLANSAQAARVATLENASSDRKLGDMNAVLSKIMLTAKSSESRRLAGDLQKAVVSRIKKSGYNIRDGGVKGAPFHVLIGASMPSVLVEVGYCSNAVEAKKLLSAMYRQKLAEGIAEGVLAYRNRLQRRSSAELKIVDKNAM